jgi:hypothetical protein
MLVLTRHLASSVWTSMRMDASIDAASMPMQHKVPMQHKGRAGGIRTGSGAIAAGRQRRTRPMPPRGVDRRSFLRQHGTPRK